MGKIWKRNCDWCGKWYEGRGARFCSRLCPQGESADLPIGDKERDFLQPVHIHITPKVYTAAKPSSDEITSVHYGDIHFPHHDPRALDIRNQILDFLDPEIVVDHGDTLDCEAISRWPKDPLNRTS